MASDPGTDKERARPSALTMITAAAASAAAFFVITKSGIAGTLVGAAVFSAVYHGASHWLGTAVERGAAWWLGRRGMEVGERPAPAVDATTLASAVEEPDSAASAAAPVLGTPDPAASADETAVSAGGVLQSDSAPQVPHAIEPPSRAGRARPSGARARRLAATWAPLVLALAAFGASGYSVVTGEPIERVIIRERVVEKPVVEERVVVQKETVTVTVPVASGRDATGNVVSTPPTSVPTTSTTVPTTSTSSTAPGGGVGGGTTVTTDPGAAEPTSTTLPPAPSSTTTVTGG